MRSHCSKTQHGKLCVSVKGYICSKLAHSLFIHFHAPKCVIQYETSDSFNMETSLSFVYDQVSFRGHISSLLADQPYIHFHTPGKYLIQFDAWNTPQAFSQMEILYPFLLFWKQRMMQRCCLKWIWAPNLTTCVQAPDKCPLQHLDWEFGNLQENRKRQNLKKNRLKYVKRSNCLRETISLHFLMQATTKIIHHLKVKSQILMSVYEIYI